MHSLPSVKVNDLLTETITVSRLFHQAYKAILLCNENFCHLEIRQSGQADYHTFHLQTIKQHACKTTLTFPIVI